MKSATAQASPNIAQAIVYKGTPISVTARLMATRSCRREGPIYYSGEKLLSTIQSMLNTLKPCH
jgi:hypothetical protein